MGSWRFFLSYCVLYTHAFGRVMGFSIGVTAVISFFVMSGYVMALLVNRYYRTPKAIAAFYVDRAARLLPQYLFYVTLTLALSPVLQLPHAYFGTRGLTNIILNVLLLPVGYYMFGVVDPRAGSDVLLSVSILLVAAATVEIRPHLRIDTGFWFRLFWIYKH
jgi:peptidoglycan/LPS O-acetylase OafA/YrhL